LIEVPEGTAEVVYVALMKIQSSSPGFGKDAVYRMPFCTAATT
jgi:hypothetical protein